MYYPFFNLNYSELTNVLLRSSFRRYMTRWALIRLGLSVVKIVLLLRSILFCPILMFLSVPIYCSIPKVFCLFVPPYG